jgi:hypothetical protein
VLSDFELDSETAGCGTGDLGLGHLGKLGLDLWIRCCRFGDLGLPPTTKAIVGRLPSINAAIPITTWPMPMQMPKASMPTDDSTVMASRQPPHWAAERNGPCRDSQYHSCLLLSGVVAVLGCWIVTARTLQGMARVRSGSWRPGKLIVRVRSVMPQGRGV